MTTLYDALESKLTLDRYVRELTARVFFDDSFKPLDSFMEFPPFRRRFDRDDFAVTVFKVVDGVLMVEGYYAKDIDSYFEYSIDSKELEKLERDLM